MARTDDVSGVTDSYIVSRHRDLFRSGEPAKVVRFCSVRPDAESGWRPAFEVEYADGRRDWIALASVLSGDADVLDGEGPCRMAWVEPNA